MKNVVRSRSCFPSNHKIICQFCCEKWMSKAFSTFFSSISILSKNYHIHTWSYDIIGFLGSGVSPSGPLIIKRPIINNVCQSKRISVKKFKKFCRDFEKSVLGITLRGLFWETTF